MLKVVDALPATYRDTASDAARRLLIDPETDLLSRRVGADEPPATPTPTPMIINDPPLHRWLDH
nr:hypothetical protein [Jiangella endophytica]